MLRNSVVVGVTATNPHHNSINYTKPLSMSAFWTGRSGPTKFSNVGIHNYPTGSVVLKTCVECDNQLKFSNRGNDIYVDQLTLGNVSGSYLFMVGLKRDVVYDLDGSFSSAFDGTSRSAGAITSYWPHIHLDNPTVCPNATTPSRWDNAIFCDSSLTVRRVMFTNVIR